MTREARPGGFGSSGGKGIAGSLLLIIVGVGVLVGALWVGINAGASYALPLIPREWDKTIGEYAMKNMVSVDNPCADTEMDQWLKQVGAMIVAEVEDQPFEYQWHVIDDETPNAFALPGGYVGVHRGLFALATRPEEVASVVAHEIIHAEKRHGMRRILGALGTQLATSLVFGGSDLAVFADQGMQLLMLKHSREQEEEADKLGRELLVRTGIDPEGMATMFEALGDSSPQPKTIPTWFSTHPDSQARAANARQGERPYQPIELPKLPEPNCKANPTNAKDN